MTKRKEKCGKIAGFINKLIDILKNKENEEIIFYNDQERSFTIKNVRRFTEEILPRYFKHRNYSSFVRQVNLYDFRKIRHEGKQEGYHQQFFDISNPKELKKIKRKPMGSEKNRTCKKNQNSSQNSQEQCEQMQDDYVQSQSQQNKSQNSNSDAKRNELNMELEDLERKKVFLQNKIRLEQVANEKLEYENTKLKSVFNSENLQFYNQLLKILENLLISQFNQGEITRSTYDKLIKYIYQQKESLDEDKRVKVSTYEETKRNGKQNREKIYRESKFLVMVKDLFIKKKQHLTIPFFIQTLLQFVERHQNYNHPQIEIIHEPFVNSDSYNQLSNAHQPLKQQFYQEKYQMNEKQKVGKINHVREKASREEEIHGTIRERSRNQAFEDKMRIKKRIKKREDDSQDQEYVPKFR